MTRGFKVAPEIVQFQNCRDFADSFDIGKGDLIFTNPSYYDCYFGAFVKDAAVVYAKSYGSGEPTAEMVDRIAGDLRGLVFKRVIAIGGGSIIDVGKLLAQKELAPVSELFAGRIHAEKEKKLVIVPTTCGTGSEVTSVSVLAFPRKRIKIGLQTESLYADYAVLIPELLQTLPDRPFAASSIDAFIHAVESYLSPKATPFSEMFSAAAVEILLRGYLEISECGIGARKKKMGEFLLASTYAGIAFGNAGCAAVHAMSMSYSEKYHIAHGEANYLIFTQVLKTYHRLKPFGKIKNLEAMLARCLGCTEQQVYQELDAVLEGLLAKKPLRAYGIAGDDIPAFVQAVVASQGRLTANNYAALDEREMAGIYRAVL